MISQGGDWKEDIYKTHLGLNVILSRGRETKYGPKIIKIKKINLEKDTMTLL